MSYDIYLKNPDGTTHEFDDPFDLRGGTYAIGGTSEAWLNITWNYGKHFYRVMGKDGIRSIYDCSAEQSIPMLESAIEKLGDDVSDDYWEPTEGNVKAALQNLLVMANNAAPNCVWSGD